MPNMTTRDDGSTFENTSSEVNRILALNIYTPPQNRRISVLNPIFTRPSDDSSPYVCAGVPLWARTRTAAIAAQSIPQSGA